MKQHSRRRVAGWLGVSFSGALALALAVGCGGGDNDGTGPGSDLDFPPLDPSVNAALCVRGNRTVGQNASSSITTSDCDYSVFIGTADAGYFEIWRVRVASVRTVTFTVSAPAFDSYLDIAQATIDNGQVTDMQQLATNDDTNGDDPVITIELQPNVDYAAVVSGFNDAATGSYTLTIE
jgi:hypothetical protein